MTSAKRHKNLLSFTEVSIFIAILIITLKIFVLDFYKVNSNSMYPTFEKNDIVIINKFEYFFKNIKKNDIICFTKYVNQDSKNKYLKRVRAVPGDSLFLRYAENKYSYWLNKDLFSLDKIILPEQNNPVELNNQNIIAYKNLIISENNSLSIIKNSIFINDNISKSYSFKNNYYFVLGDFTDISIDSRKRGFVSEDKIIGKAIFSFSLKKLKFKWIS